MRTIQTWSDKVPERDGFKSTVWDLCFSPDGTQLIVAVGVRVLVYDANDGDLMHSLKGHKDTVYTVDYSKDGKRFASGGADCTIFIWTSAAEGLLKYSHNDTIQKLVYNPVTGQLASCTASDFGLWSPEQKSVQKHKVPSKILSASWTNDGQYIALGMLSGAISIRDKSGAEKVSIQREAPIWTLSWNPSRDEPFDLLAVGCWDQTLSFYQLSGMQHGKDRVLGFDPCSVSYYNNGEYLIVAGSDKKATLMTKEGVKLSEIATQGDWVWAAKGRPKQNYVAVACNDGTVGMHQLAFSTVHGLYQDRYAYRDTMTDVIVQHLITEQKVRIKCRDYVKKIAVYRDRLAVQLPDRVHIYELAHDDAFDMHYRIKEKIHEHLECNLLVVTSQHLILCLEKKLQLYNFGGKKEREWVLEAVIRYIKVVGGPAGKEGLLVGLKSGSVLKIFVDNPFPIQLIKQKTSIRCLDLSASRRKLAVVDENANCLVYDLDSKELLFTESNANSVAWNTEAEDMLCFSGNGMLSIKTGMFPLHQQKLQGFVVGFNGSKIFCLHYVAMQTIDVPQSSSMYRYVESREWGMAYKVACLGVTDSDWRSLGIAALQSMKLDIARKAFIRIRDMKYIELLNSIEQLKKTAGSAADSLCGAEVMAYQGRYQDAAKLFIKAGSVDKAVDMFADLGLWDEVTKFASEHGSMDLKALMSRHAKWSEEVGDFKTAATMYQSCGQYAKAFAIFGEHGMLTELMEGVRKVDAAETEALKVAAGYVRRSDDRSYAKEVYLKLNDINSLMELHVEAKEWKEAFSLAEQYPGKFDETVFLPYAEWLAIEDKFEEAQAAYERFGRLDLAVKILQQLTHNAVVENRFADAANGYYHLAEEHVRIAQKAADDAAKASISSSASPSGGITSPVVAAGGQDVAALGLTPSGPAPLSPEAAKAAYDKFQAINLRADVYYAYELVQKAIDSPFTAAHPETLFHAAQFLLNTLSILPEVPFRVSIVYVLYTLAKQGYNLGAYKMARMAFDRLGVYRVPVSWQDAVDLTVLTIQSKPFSDKEDLLPYCYRCSSNNPLISSARSGDCCVNCGHPFIRTFSTFDPLPLVKFVPEAGISDEEAIKLIAMDPLASAPVTATPQVPEKKRKGVVAQDSWKQSASGGAETLTFNDAPAATKKTDPFEELLTGLDSVTTSAALEVSASVLRALSPNEVFIRRPPNASLPVEFFKNMIPDLLITLCNRCGRFFHSDDLELEVLKKKQCPFCRCAENDIGLP